MSKRKTNLGHEALFTEQAGARLLGVGRFVLLRARQRGAIGFYRFGGGVYYTEQQLKDYKERCERPAAAQAA